MKKIDQGSYEIFTTKKDAIDRFMKLQGYCREELEDESVVEFFCRRNGTISIFDATGNSYRNNSTHLSAKLIEKDGKTYLTYYTSYSNANNITNLIYWVVTLLFFIFSIVYAIISGKIAIPLPIFLVALGICFWNLFMTSSEGQDSYQNSKIMVKELEKRVETVNLWDK